MANANTSTSFLWGGSHQYQTDYESGLYLLGIRYYDPAIGRFISQDPAQDESNWYSYCGNNPLVAVDPEGKSPVLIGIVVGAAVMTGAYIAYDYYHGTEPLTSSQQNELKQLKNNLLAAAHKAGDRQAERIVAKLDVTRRFQRGKPDKDDATSWTTPYLWGSTTTIRSNFFDAEAKKDSKARYETLLHESTHAAHLYGNNDRDENRATDWSMSKWAELSPYVR